ncbi:MAG: FtsX-like permease family protein, partial [Ilumatobacteraceae bacterium]
AAGIDIVGIGMAPEYFYVTAEEGGFFAEANFAALFMPLATAQQFGERPGRVNDLVIDLSDGADAGAVQAELQRLFDESDIGLGVTVMTRDDDTTYRLLYDDIDSDARFWRVFAALILGGAALGAFNLSARMVDAQRRELGIGMALGAARWQLAVRPMLVGLETAVASVVLGIGMGALSVLLIKPIFAEALPLPIWITDFQWMPFARGAALGFAIPLAASAWPVLRAVRMTPVEAIATTHRNSRSGMSRLLRRLPWPRSAFRRMPLGNVLRTPRRTILTSIGLGATIATLVAILGMIDSFAGTMFGNEAEVLGSHPDRVVVALQSVAAEEDAVAAVTGLPGVGEVSPVLQVGARLAPADGAVSTEADDADGFDIVLEALDLDGGVWHPTSVGDLTRPGIVIAESAADDLGVSVGDVVALTHPSRTATGFTTATSEVEVIGIHPSPFRFSAYVDRSLLGSFGAEGLANELFVVPAAGSTVSDVQRELFTAPGIGSAVPASASIDILRDVLSEFTGILRITQAFMLLLALAMTYNTTSINADERARERATLFAFGLPVTRVVTLEVAEGLLYGLIGTAIGLGAGAGITRWMMGSMWRTTMPDMALETIISGTTVLTAVVLGVVAVSVAPLLTMRRLLRMDVPSTLRVVE